MQAGAKVARHRITLTRRLLRQWARLQMRILPHWESMRLLFLTLRQKLGTAWQVCFLYGCAHHRGLTACHLAR